MASVHLTHQGYGQGKVEKQTNQHERDHGIASFCLHGPLHWRLHLTEVTGG